MKIFWGFQIHLSQVDEIHYGFCLKYQSGDI